MSSVPTTPGAACSSPHPPLASPVGDSRGGANMQTKIAAGFAAIGLLLAAHAQAATPKDTLVMAWNLDALITFDPAQIAEVNGNDIIRNVCDPLVQYDPKDPTH